MLSCVLVISLLLVTVINSQQEGGRQDINIHELLRLSGQNPNMYQANYPNAPNNPNSYPELHPPNDLNSIDYDSNLYKQLISNQRPPPSNMLPPPSGAALGNKRIRIPDEIIMQEKTIDNLLGFVKGVILCGGEGWCGTRCCTVSNRAGNVQHRPSGGLRRKQKMCYPVCQPLCAPKCIEAARILMQTRNVDNFKLSGGDMDPASNSEKSLIASIPLCRPACMPSCKESCLKKKQRPMKVTCRPACMPECTPTCVASPPLMVPCMGGVDKSCSCPPGYVQCSKYTCCMRYRTMAVRYRKLLPGYLYADNSTLANATTTSTSTTSEGLLSVVNINETLNTAGNFFQSMSSLWTPGNQTTLYLNALKNMTFPVLGSDAVDYEVVYDYDENTDAGKAEFDAVTTIP